MLKNKSKGFTLIELIMVTIILGILAVTAAPKFLSTVSKAQEAVEEEIIAKLEAGLESYAMEQLTLNGRRSWPENPFDALGVTPTGYIDVTGTRWVEEMEDDSWGVMNGIQWNIDGVTYTSWIMHQRSDNSRWAWLYDKGVSSGDAADVGSILKYGWVPVGGQPQEILYEDANPQMVLYNIHSR